MLLHPRTVILASVLSAIVAAPATPQSFSVTASVSGPEISMSWTAVPGATSYLVDGGTQPGVYSASNLPASSTGFSVQAPWIGTFYLRARALAGTTVIATSNEVPVTVTSLVKTPVSVEAYSYCGGVLLRWASGGGSPSGYRVSVSGAANATFNTTQTQFYASVAPVGSYEFTVTALAGNNQSSPSSPVLFTVGGQPVVPAPIVTSSSYGQFVSAQWTSVPGANGYNVQAFQNGTPVQNLSLPSSTTSISANNVPLATYTIRVAATTACGLQSASGETSLVVDGNAPSGPRTPNPAPGQRLPLPSYGREVIIQLAAERRDLVVGSCVSQGGNNRFMFEAVRRLRARDTRWGLNWKRGNRGDLSQDIVTYNFGSRSDEDTTDVYIIDIIGGHCPGPTDPPSSWNWEDVTGKTAAAGSIGRWTLLPYIAAGYTP